MLEKLIVKWKDEFFLYCDNRKLAESTRIIYWGAIECFLRHFNTVSVSRINWKKIAEYVSNYDSARTKDQKKYAIQLFYSVCLKIENKCYKIPNSKPEQKIPEVLNIDEIYRVFMGIKNFKQCLAIKFAYHCALRISEVQNAKINKLDFTTGFFFVQQDKGKKDRVVPIPSYLQEELITYLNERFPQGYTGNEYLFDGQKNFKGMKKEQYSRTSLRNIFRKACKKAGILKKVKFHSIRHSMATHWHNSGVMTLRDIADLLGHNNTKTTEIYLHTQNENLRDKALMAGEIIKSKMTFNQLNQPIKTFQKFVDKLQPSIEKQYQILFNGKMYILKEENDKIIDAPHQHKWSIGVETKKAMSWFKQKGAIIHYI